ncbi:7076_t:CDS:2 [Acaulospora colombiana]|uniref:7076_t:CDS:1 n=1 Tax=Acaulospora colombiana TaxID=27376 RepID=A0ACA9LVL2_9GLOM|nr:7076_t:CDS:2 [Acaulospora colombiana]
MEQITPPRRQRDLLNNDQQADQETLRKYHDDSSYALYVVLNRDDVHLADKSTLSTNHETPDSELTQRDAILINAVIPSTPQTTIESNDGSQLRTPFANVTSWNGVSPGIVSTPTPDFYSLNREPRMSAVPSGATFYPTPQFPVELSTFRNVRQGMESPLKSKGPRAQPVQEEVQSSDETQDREITPESGIRPLILEPSHSTEEIMPEDAAIDEDSTDPPVRLDNISPPVTGEVISDAPLDGSQANHHSSIQHSLPIQNTPSSRKMVIPESIQKWLQGPSSSFDASTTIHRKDIQEITRKRLERFDPQNTRSSPLVPQDHEAYGRILQPPSKDDQDTEVTSVLDWPDDAYPWSLLSSKENFVDMRRQQDLQLIAKYLEESSESDDDEDSKPNGVTDPADALAALRAKKATRQLIQRKAVKAAVAKATKGKVTASKASSSELRKAKDDIKDVMELDKNGEDSDEVACICNGADDGRPMVQCDRCHTWHHVDCVTKEGEELPEEWFCGKCLASSSSGKAIDIDESSLSTHERPDIGTENNPAFMHVYLSKDTNSLSPGVPQFFISRDGHIFGNRTPPSSKSSLPRYPYPYSMWPDSSTSPRPSTDHFDDPMTAIAATPFGTSSLGSAYGSSEDPFFDNLHSTPSRSLGLRFAPPFSASPKKDRPWTNYTGAFATPSGASGSHPTFIFNQSVPIVQTDPLFIHYEHDAPKQTAHHHNGYSRSKKRGKMKDKDSVDMEKMEDRDSVLPDDVPSSDSTNVNHETDLSSSKLS